MIKCLPGKGDPVTMSDVPKYMQPGSRDPAVNTLLSFLWCWAANQIKGNHHRIALNGVFAGEAVEWLKRLQTHYNLDVDDGCGPQTREFMKTLFGFDFTEVARTTGGRNVFVQPDGSEVEWELPAAA